jgi:beta-galactosidase
MKPAELKMKFVESVENRPEVGVDFDDSDWQPAFQQNTTAAKAIVYRSTFCLPKDFNKGEVMLYLRTIGQKQFVYLNGTRIGEEMNQKTDRYTIKPDTALLKPGKNVLVFVTTPYFTEQIWQNPNTDPGVIQLIMPAPNYKRSLFSGKAQVIVQAANYPGEIKLTAKSEGLIPAVLSIYSIN